MLSGSIPASLCSLSGLKYMVLNRNLLTGSIPSCFGFLVALNELVLSDNDFEGSLPNELAQLEGLESLYLDDNRFSGNPSTVWNNLRNLTHLMANNNNFVSEIDINFLASNWELQWLDLSSNGFMSKGMFPDQLFRLSLEALDISDNRLTCDFHDTLPKNTDLKFLSLYHNKITGPLACLSMLEGLVHMDLSDNEIIGSMEPIGKLTSLKVLFLSENPFDAGPVPESFSKLTNLTELSLRSTRRTGTLPDLATSLRFVDLGYNSFTGSIPANYGDKSNLAYMLLNNNEQVTGELPSSLEGLTSLRGAFLHGTSLDSKTMNFLCMLQENQQQQESRQDAEDQVLWANCDTCSCQGCRCCDAALSTDCSQLPLDNIAGSWKNEFQRKKYTIMTAPQESSTRSGDGTRF